MRKWMPAFLIAVSLLASLLARARLPARVAVDFSQLLPFGGGGDETASSLIVFLFPALALAIWLAFSFGRSSSGTRMQKWLFGRWAPAEVLEPAAFERFRATYDVVVNLVVFIVLFQLLTIGLALGGPSWLVRGFSLLVGVGIAALGNVMPRVRPNPIMGVRTPTTLNDPRNWARTHRVLGACFMMAGIIMVALTFVLPRYAFMVGIAGLLLSCVVAFVYSTSLRTHAGANSLLVLLLLLAAPAIVHAQALPDSIPPAGVAETA